MTEDRMQDHSSMISLVFITSVTVLKHYDTTIATQYIRPESLKEYRGDS